MREKCLLFFAMGMLLLTGLPAHARPDLKMTMVTEKELTVVKAGKTVVTRVPARQSMPGEVLVYTLNYRNVGNEKTTLVNVDNPLPVGTRYMADSATGATVNFSVDGGKTYGAPEHLMKIEPKKRSKAQVSDYTNIRWVLGEILPGQSGKLSYRVRVE